MKIAKKCFARLILIAYYKNSETRYIMNMDVAVTAYVRKVWYVIRALKIQVTTAILIMNVFQDVATRTIQFAPGTSICVINLAKKMLTVLRIGHQP
jgi:hypothetical protein